MNAEYRRLMLAILESRPGTPEREQLSNELRLHLAANADSARDFREVATLVLELAEHRSQRSSSEREERLDPDHRS